MELELQPPGTVEHPPLDFLSRPATSDREAPLQVGSCSNRSSPRTNHTFGPRCLFALSLLGLSLGAHAVLEWEGTFRFLSESSLEEQSAVHCNDGNGRPSPSNPHAVAAGLGVACAVCDLCVVPLLLSLQAGHVSCTGMDGKVANWKETQDAFLDFDFAFALRFTPDDFTF